MYFPLTSSKRADCCSYFDLYLAKSSFIGLNSRFMSFSLVMASEYWAVSTFTFSISFSLSSFKTNTSSVAFFLTDLSFSNSSISPSFSSTLCRSASLSSSVAHSFRFSLTVSSFFICTCKRNLFSF